MKPYQTIPIRDCGEAMVAMPKADFAFFAPHPYTPYCPDLYHDTNPWQLRQSVLDALLGARDHLAQLKAGWKIYIFDTYRPHAVQAFMVARELGIVAREHGYNPQNLTPTQREECMAKVLLLWGMPSDNPQTPPPHSTGAVIDCTLMDESGREVDMGSPIDENSARSMPDYFADKDEMAHNNRALLNKVMREAGFTRHLREWWHFSIGDQYAVWRAQEDNIAPPPAHAIYGRADLLES